MPGAAFSGAAWPDTANTAVALAVDPSAGIALGAVTIASIELGGVIVASIELGGVTVAGVALVVALGAVTVAGVELAVGVYIGSILPETALSGPNRTLLVMQLALTTRDANVGSTFSPSTHQTPYRLWKHHWDYAPVCLKEGGPLVMIVAALACLRILTLTTERVSLNRLGQSGYGAFATMGIGFGGAAIVLAGMSLLDAVPIPFRVTFWTGALYALAFGLYTAAFVRGPIGLVSPWSNATVVLLWLYHPLESDTAWWGLALFAVGVLILTHRQFNRAVVMMLLSDVVLACARVMDVHHTEHAPVSYAAGLFLSISLWMLIPVVISGQHRSLMPLMRSQPGWSFVAATSNAAAYLSVFTLLKWLHPAVVEAFSALASSLATFVGVFVFHEKQGTRKVFSSILVTAGTILLLMS